MKTKSKALLALVLSVMMIAAMAVPAYADVPADAIVTLGGELTAEERAAVLSYMGLSEESLASYRVITVTNAEEYEYLGEYMTAAQIGDRAMSSCVVSPAVAGNGIKVTTDNITYCTPEMYESALATAGAKDINVHVVAPYPMSGTAALVGAMKAYAEQEGVLIEPENFDGAVNEIVTTSQVAESVGDKEKVAQLIAAVKQIIAAENIKDEAEIEKIIIEISEKLEISLSDEDRQMILELMKKLSGVTIDVDALTEQAGTIYEELKDQGIDLSSYGISESDMGGILGFFGRLWNSIVSFFKGLGG